MVSPHTFGGVNAPARDGAPGPATPEASDVAEYHRPTPRKKSRGQTVAEFALILPVMLAFLGVTLDFARVFQAWITLESATRDGAEAAATNGTSTANALDIAQRAVCIQSQNIPGFTRSTLTSPNDVQLCAAPTVTVVSFSRSTTAPNSALYPLGSATIQARMNFSPLLSWPVITQNGTWTITSQASFSIIQNRQ